MLNYQRVVGFDPGTQVQNKDSDGILYKKTVFESANDDTRYPPVIFHIDMGNHFFTGNHFPWQTTKLPEGKTWLVGCWWEYAVVNDGIFERKPLSHND